MRKITKNAKLKELIESNSLLELINDEFNVEAKLDDEEITIEDVEDLLLTIEWLKEDWYDHIDIFDEWEYRVIKKSMIDRVFEESVISMVDDCYLHDVSDFIKNYFDYDKFVRDCKMDWYWHHFNSYDWWEIEWHGFYLFRN